MNTNQFKNITDDDQREFFKIPAFEENICHI